MQVTRCIEFVDFFFSLFNANIGTGNVLKIQKMLHYCNDHLDPEKEDDKFQAFAVIGVAMIAMGEDVGADMASRSFNHLVRLSIWVIGNMKCDLWC